MWHLLSIIATFTKIHPKYKEVVVGNDVEFTCGKSLSEALTTTWFLNMQYYISDDIRIENSSIFIDNVQLNHSGTYQCVKAYYDFFLNFGTIYMANAELKVFGKLTFEDYLP